MSEVTRYKAGFACTKCNAELTYGQKMDSHGVCPYGGVVSGYTVVDTKTISIPYTEQEPEVVYEDISLITLIQLVGISAIGVIFLAWWLT